MADPKLDELIFRASTAAPVDPVARIRERMLAGGIVKVAGGGGDGGPEPVQVMNPGIPFVGGQAQRAQGFQAGQSGVQEPAQTLPHPDSLSSRSVPVSVLPARTMPVQGLLQPRSLEQLPGLLPKSPHPADRGFQVQMIEARPLPGQTGGQIFYDELDDKAEKIKEKLRKGDRLDPYDRRDLERIRQEKGKTRRDLEREIDEAIDRKKRDLEEARRVGGIRIPLTPAEDEWVKRRRITDDDEMIVYRDLRRVFLMWTWAIFGRDRDESEETSAVRLDGMVCLLSDEEFCLGLKFLLAKLRMVLSDPAPPLPFFPAMMGWVRVRGELTLVNATYLAALVRFYVARRFVCLLQAMMKANHGLGGPFGWPDLSSSMQINKQLVAFLDCLVGLGLADDLVDDIDSLRDAILNPGTKWVGAGNASAPNVRRVRKIGEALGVDVSDIKRPVDDK